MFGRRTPRMPRPDDALPGRETPLEVDTVHAVNGHSMTGPFPEGSAQALVGLGCFWGAERLFWRIRGVWVTSVGYAGGFTPNPTYREVCSGRTGHAEVVHVVFDPAELSYELLLRAFWENHDPTQGMRQGGDVGTQYRSAIYTYDDAQRTAAQDSLLAYQAKLTGAGLGAITTEIRAAPDYFLAETSHQQYLHKNPAGYCGLAGTGVSCPIGAQNLG